MLACTRSSTHLLPAVAMCLLTSCGPRSTPHGDADVPPDVDAETEPCTPCGCDIPEEMVCVPEGPYLSYSPHFDQVREFYISAFLIDRFEVTNVQLRQCVEAGGCLEGRLCSLTRPEYLIDPMYDDYPVAWRYWYEADVYCRWAGKRLPTSAEWEKAARGGCEVLGESPECEPDLDLPEYPWGAEPAPAPCLYGNDMRLCVGDTVAVGSYPEGASPYGVMDMLGNVMEWVNGWYSPWYFVDAPYRDPPGPSEISSRYCGDDHDPCRGLRGPSFVTTPDTYMDSNLISFRGKSSPDFSGASMGFRCARDAEDTEGGGE